MNVIRLCAPQLSSFVATLVSVLTVPPVKAAKVVSKFVVPPQVWNVTVPELAAVQLYQIVFNDPPP